jgi:hypothetical protein
MHTTPPRPPPAGEATTRKYPGTVHGAYVTGERAAAEVEEYLRDAGLKPKARPPPAEDELAPPGRRAAGNVSATGDLPYINTSAITSSRKRNGAGGARGGALAALAAALLAAALL